MYKINDIIEYTQLETLDYIHIGKIVAKCMIIEGKNNIKNEIFYYVEFDVRCYPKIVFENQIIGLHK